MRSCPWCCLSGRCGLPCNGVSRSWACSIAVWTKSLWACCANGSPPGKRGMPSKIKRRKGGATRNTGWMPKPRGAKHFTRPSTLVLLLPGKCVSLATFSRMWVWQTISSWSQFATLNDLEEESETRRLGTGGAFDPRGEKVILDADLARIYGVETAQSCGEAQRRPFPPDFVFRLPKGNSSVL